MFIEIITGPVQVTGCGMTGLSPVAHKSVQTSLIFGNISGPNIRTGTSITVRWTAATGALMKKTALPQHIQNIHKWKPVADVASQQIKCPKCNKPFSQKNKMQTHLLICGNQDKPFSCSECNEGFRDRDRLHIHKKQKHPQRAGDHSAYYKCDFCPKEYTSISSRRRHMEAVHKK